MEIDENKSGRVVVKKARGKQNLKHQRTSSSIFVDEKEAIESSLAQLGNGIKLSDEQAKEFTRRVLKPESENLC